MPCILFSIYSPLEHARLLRRGRDHKVVSCVLADQLAVVFVAAVLVEHPGGDDVAYRDVDVVGAEVLQVADDRLGLAADDKLGEGGHVNDADTLAANQVLFLK
jgi:hypothetical protein